MAVPHECDKDAARRGEIATVLNHRAPRARGTRGHSKLPGAAASRHSAAAMRSPPTTKTTVLPRGLGLRALGALLVTGLTLLGGADGQKWKTELGPCYRDCTKDPEPRTCYYVFVEEIYATLTQACGNCSLGNETQCYQNDCVFADGVERTMYSINRMLPGPAIHVCRGDTIRVDLRVHLPGHAETIHWHGLPQADTPWMDGVAWVTQCPVIYGNTFRYEFLAEPAGTYFYHSHSGLHKVNGVVGCMIIRDSHENNVHCHKYDYDLGEHVILLQDWMHVPAEFVLPGLAHRITGQPADACLINGQGSYTRPSTGNTTKTPLAVFEISPGKRYRFRIINAGSLSCPIQIQFESHTMIVIAADGLDIEPQSANSLVTISGERWDVVITGKKRPTAGAYWIYVRTVGFCTNQGFSEQRALLVYKGANSRVPATAAPAVRQHRQLPTGTVVNPPGDCEGSTQVCASELSAAVPPTDYTTRPRSKAQKLVFFRLRFDFLPPPELFDAGNGMNDYEKFLAFGSTNLAATLNKISYTEPSAPFLTQPGKAPYCNEDRKPQRCANETVCDCAHLVKVPYDKTIDVIIVETSDINLGDNSTNLLAHPMHLHGTSFSCMGMGTLRNITNGTERAETVYDLWERRALPTSVPHPALKDVLTLPGAGWAWFRFRATNRGCWFFHCHFQYHMAGGMEAVIQVGETKQLPKPPRNFPKCSNYFG
ncbi:L-ascorbate oxidase [Frankliniella fusca]|uniref:L-ascorbate oxidase n=1 Tax=Frankliniella fusca TaxID=407009 RepID=A0AAE1HAY9_9NEOP|nr:L-ascorbate oxidase [Frankliniella fusca]